MSETYGRLIVEKQGGPEVMQWVEEPVRHAGAGEVRVIHEAIGVDFIDTQIRSGILPATLPTGVGLAGVGTAKEVGDDVTHVRVGDRVAYMYFTPGSYATERVVPADRVVVLPDQAMPADVAAAALFRGLTAWYLTTRLRTIGPGEFALVHAAAGGVGLILSQWLRHLGVTVIGVVGNEGKAAVAREYGVDHVVDSSKEDFVAKVREVTGGKGASIVYDNIGIATFERSLDCARRFGLVVSYGWPSGDPVVSLSVTRNKGSLFLTRPTVTQYTAESADLQEGAKALFGLVSRGALKIKVGSTFPLRDAGKAHEALSAGRTVGSTVLIP